jgi:PAS domain S-box-containing protein
MTNLSQVRHDLNWKPQPHKQLRLKRNHGKPFDELFQFLPYGVLMVQANGKIKIANPAFIRMIGAVDESQVIGKKISHFIVPGDAANLVSSLDMVIEGILPEAHIETNIVCKDHNSFPAEISIGKITLDSEALAQVILCDVTDYHQAEDQVVRSNIELEMSYTATLDGWSRALELRDLETQGHSRRVTELTVDISLAMGISLEDIMHIRHGALLHDIGKMAVPDSILLKPGPLTPEERLIMEQHPVHAYNLLSPILYLQPAIDIPWCHHEKWDGTGYPRKLKGEEIPFCARIFSVIDVWDALMSDRPYRKAWEPTRVYSYIEECSGTSFDPDVVTFFIKYMKNTRNYT